MLRFLTSFAFFGLVSPAHAHLGHVGELAGHAHWVGLGATVVAGALAIAIGKLTEKNSDEVLDEETELGEEAPVEG